MAVNIRFVDERILLVFCKDRKVKIIPHFFNSKLESFTVISELKIVHVVNSETLLKEDINKVVREEIGVKTFDYRDYFEGKYSVRLGEDEDGRLITLRIYEDEE